MNKKFVVATIYLTVGDQRIPLDTVAVSTSKRSVTALVSLVGQFIEDLSTAVTVAMLQATSVGNFAGVEVEVNVNDFEPEPFVYRFQIIPPKSRGKNKRKSEVENAITVEVDTVCLEISMDVVYFLVMSVAA